MQMTIDFAHGLSFAGEGYDQAHDRASPCLGLGRRDEPTTGKITDCLSFKRRRNQCFMKRTKEAPIPTI